MNDKIVFGQYYPSNSWIHKLDPRVKLISIMVMMISLFILDDIRILLGFLGGLLIVILTTKIPLVKFLNSIKMMSFVLAITFFLQLFFRKEGNIIADYDFNLTWLNLGIIIVVLLMWFMFLGRRIKAFKTPTETPVSFNNRLNISISLPVGAVPYLFFIISAGLNVSRAVTSLSLVDTITFFLCLIAIPLFLSS